MFSISCDFFRASELTNPEHRDKRADPRAVQDLLLGLRRIS
jgi:hypothetical protein